MNNRTRDDRDPGDRERHPYRQYGSQEGGQERGYEQRHRRYGGRSDRDIQSDFSGGGYDQVGGRDYRGGGYGREGSYPQSRSLSPDDDSRRGRYDSEFGYGSGASGYSGAGYGYGGAGAGGVGYGAPGYGAGAGYASANRYHGDFQTDRDWLRDEGEGFSGYDYNRGMDARYGANQYGGAAREGRHSQESYGQ